MANVAYELRREGAVAADIFTKINEGEFNRGHHYPVVFEAREEGIFVAHGVDSSSLGIRVDKIQDADGRYVALEALNSGSDLGKP